MSMRSHLFAQDLAASLLEAAARRPVQAYLLVGPERTGKSLAARLFVQALNCAFARTVPDQEPESRVQRPTSDVRSGFPCGNCEPCRAIAGGYFTDWRTWSPDPSRKKRSIKIDQIRQIERLSLQHPLAARYQVLQVNEAHAMEHEAAQCFLKTLEEPASHTIHLLLATSTAGLLATILSRCQIIPFYLAAPMVIARQLQEHLHLPAERAQVLASMAQGRIGWAVARARDEEPEPPRMDGVAEWPQGRLEASRLAEKWLSRPPEEVIANIQEFQRLLQEKVIRRGSVTPTHLETLQLCEDAIEQLARFVSPKLVLEVTLTRLTRVAAEVKK